MPTLVRCMAAALLALALLPAAASARGSNANVAALQVALRALHHYRGGIDGIPGPNTKSAVRGFQRSHRLPVDGVVGPRTRRALGRRGAPLLGRRVMRRGNHGWDVAALQFMLRRRGYPSGSVDGGFGANTLSAVRRFQSAAGLRADGRAGPGTLRALRHHARRPAAPSGGGGGGGAPTGPVRFLRPINAPMGDGFGHPGGRRHDGIDFPAPMGSAVGAAGVGSVTFAGWNSGGYGNLVVVQHRLGYQTWYAHLSRFAVSVGSSVAGGRRIGYVGSTGHSTGPHLHFEVRLNGVPINPLPMLLAQTSLGKLPVLPAPQHAMDCPAGGSAKGGGGHDPRRARLRC
jgi:peptidoglycan hydrolase-like protein with peptidoglycan-binding domain